MKIIFAIILAALIASAAEAATDLYPAWFYVSDNPTITLAWDPVTNATRYEAKMIAQYPAQEWLKTITAPTVIFNRPRTGLFKFAVRSCNATECSAWSLSDGPNSTVKKADGTTIAQPWIMYWRLSAPIINP